MHLIMFDVDGTLVQSNDVDTVCFSEAVKQILGLDELDSDWGKYQNATDSGIASEIIDKHFSRRATEYELSSIHDLFVKKIGYEIRENPHYFDPVPGAPELFRYLRSCDDYSIAIATGGWRDSSFLKLGAAGISIRDIPFASSDDSPEREEIMKRAYKIAQEKQKTIAFDSVSYVGDEVWDVIASRNLEYNFIGVASGMKANKLKKEGAINMVDDLTDIDLFISLLH